MSDEYTFAFSRLQSPDAETAGAAFVTLMALMGDDAAASLGGSGAATNALLAVDSHYGLLAPAAGEALPACKLGCIPTDGQLMEALRANGYSPQPGGASGGRGGKPPAEQRRQQQGAAAAAGGQQQGQEGPEADGPPKMQRIQAVKLILRTAAAVCRYCAKARLVGGAGWCTEERPSCPLIAPSSLPLRPAFPACPPPAAPGRGGGRAEPRGLGRPAAGGAAPGAGSGSQPAG